MVTDPCHLIRGLKLQTSYCTGQYPIWITNGLFIPSFPNLMFVFERARAPRQFLLDKEEIVSFKLLLLEGTKAMTRQQGGNCPHCLPEVSGQSFYTGVYMESSTVLRRFEIFLE